MFFEVIMIVVKTYNALRLKPVNGKYLPCLRSHRKLLRWTLPRHKHASKTGHVKNEAKTRVQVSIARSPGLPHVSN